LERLQVGGLQLWADHYANKSNQVRLLVLPGR
jgi:hypothetical protein